MDTPGRAGVAAGGPPRASLPDPGPDARRGVRPEPPPAPPLDGAPFRARFEAVFAAAFPRLFRVLDRASDDPELAGDLAQEAFLRLWRRGALPDAPEAWLVSVGLNLLRNARARRGRRRALLTPGRGARAHGEPPPSPAARAEGAATRRRVRRVLDALPERDRHLLLLRAEGFRYTEMAETLGLEPTSVGTLLARARRAFKDRWETLDEDDADAPR